MTDCIFCQIVAGKIPGDIVYQDEEVIAFRDINPVAPTHLLILPRRHIPSLAQMPDAEIPLIGHMVKVANQLAKEEGVFERGYRIVINSGKDGGQAVPHLHMHLLGGRRLSDVPG
ncbi:Purine nucleoside phosphoramidase [subsurface metagenome]